MNPRKVEEVKKKQGSSSREVEWVPTICNFCSTVCNLKVGVKEANGKKVAVKIDGNERSPLNRGKACARGQAGFRQTYDKARLTTPLIRVPGSKRGEWNFKPATWEEAYGYIMQKMQEHQVMPWEITMMGGWTSCVFYMPLALGFAVANGIPNIVAAPMQQCVASGHLGTDMVTGNFNIHDEVLADFENAKYIVFSMTNSGVAAASTSRLVRLAEAKKRGAKIVVLDPRLSELAAKADEWLPIKPGTDSAFFLAMINVILRRGLFEREYVVKHTNMPFLMIEHQGMFVPFMEQNEQGYPKAFFVYDEISGEIRKIPGYLNQNYTDIEGRGIRPALTLPEGVTFNGQKVKTVFELLIEQSASFTPEWAAEETGIPAETIERIAVEFGTVRPAMMDPGWHGARYENVINTRRLQAMLQALVGGIDTAGGWLMSAEYREKIMLAMEKMQAGEEAPVLYLPGIQFPLKAAGMLFDPNSWYHGHPHYAIAKAMQDKAEGKETIVFPAFSDYGLKEAVEGKLMFNGEPYRIKTIILNASNPIRHYYPESRWQEILTNPNLALVVAIDVLPSDTTLYADVILPNLNYIERDEPFIYGAGPSPDLAYTTRFKAVDGPELAKGTADILFEFAIGFGNLEKFMATVAALAGFDHEEIKEEVGKALEGKQTFTRAMRNVSFKHYAKMLKTTPEKLEQEMREKGVLLVETKEHLMEHGTLLKHLPVPTMSGRLEFYSYLMAGFVQMYGYQKNWDPGLVYMPPETKEVKLAANEFHFIYGKVPTVSYASTNSNNPLLMALSKVKGGKFLGVWVNRKKGQSLNLKDGDVVVLENAQNPGFSAKAVVFLTEMVRPDTIFISSSFGTKNPMLENAAGIGTPLNNLVPYKVEPFVTGFKSQEFTVRIIK